MLKKKRGVDIIASLVLFSEEERRETSVRGGKKVVGKREHAGNLKEEVISLSLARSLQAEYTKRLQ